MTPKGSDLQATDLVEVSTLVGGSYVTKSITGQDIIDAAAGTGITNITTNAPLATTGGTTPDLSISEADGTTDGYLTAVDWSTFNSKQAALVSGTNIKTIEGQSLLGAGNINLTATDVGLGNVDNTSDLNKPVSTATQTALNAKQDTLTLTTTGTSGPATLVGATLNIPQYTGGGGGIHALTKPVSGRRISYGLTTASTTGSNFTASRLQLVPFVPANTFTISDILMFCNIAVAGSLCRLLIYSDNNGLPDSKLYESSNLDLSTTGFKIATTTFTFNAGTTYWLAFHGNATTSNVIHYQVGSLYQFAQSGSSVQPANSYFISATLGSAPANITSPTLGTGSVPWIAVTPA